MVNTRLEIKDISYPFAVNIPVVLTFNLSDVREPDKRKASFSKTINLPATNEINKLFENIFEVNIATQYFNKNKKTPVKYFVNELLNFKGDLQLIKINIKPDKSIEYEVSVIGEGGSLFVDIGEKYITGNADVADDLDFSAYDHTYNRATQRSTRSNYGTGLNVVYPFIDKGSNGGSDITWNTNDFLPCLHLFEYVKKIIEKTGRTFTSTFLNSSEFKKIIVYPNLENIELTTLQLSNRQFYVGLNSDVTGLSWPPAVVNNNNETAPFFDAGNQVSGTTVTLNDNGNYNVVTHDVFEFSFTHTNPAVVKAVYANQIFSTSRVLMSTDGGANYSVLSYSDSPFIDNTIGILFEFNVSTAYTQIIEFAIPNYYYAGTMFKKDVGMQLIGTPTFYDAGGSVITTGTATFSKKLKSGINGSTFYCLATGKNVTSGNALVMNNALPKKIKQKDFLKSVVQAFNLYIDIDPANENNLIIESFDAFYNTSTPVNYENKTDLSKDQSINPNLLEGKRYIYKYKDDVDYWNDLYKKNNNETFGTEQIDIDNDFTNSDKINEIIFSSTPNVANYGLGIAHPRIVKRENGIVSGVTPNIRMLYCGGVKTSQNSMTYKETGQPDLLTNQYLYAGHTDDPFNPTVDLNFGIPKEVFYSYINSYFTNNNLFNRYHKYYLDTITDRDSKIVTKYLWLSPKDINQFNFRNRIFNDGAYWIVNKIVNYDALKEQSTLCELIKLKKSNVFVPVSVPWKDVGADSGLYAPQQRLNSSFSQGNNITNLGENCIAIGNNIVIPANAKNVTVIGNDVVVENGVQNSSLINTSSYRLSASNSMVSNSVVMEDYFVDGTFTTVDGSPNEIVFNTPNGLFDLQNIDVVIRAEIRILAVDTSNGDCKEWKGAKIIKNISGTTSTYNIETVASIYSDASMSACTANLYDDSTPPSIECGIQGLAGTNIIWKCYINFLKTII